MCLMKKTSKTHFYMCQKYGFVVEYFEVSIIVSRKHISPIGAINNSLNFKEPKHSLRHS